MPATALPDTIREVFSPAGPLSRSTWFEDRPQQTSMACAIAEALVERRHLLVEAPTGVGKTLAYLIPALLYTLQTGRKAVVSTYTKNLQDQILRNDVPIAQSALGRQFDVVILKGRRNYLCPTRLEYALGSARTLFDTEAAQQLATLHRWSETTADGDLENLGFVLRPDIWDMVCSDKDICSSKTCGTSCFFRQRRERLRNAHLVVMNHALFFTLLALQEIDDGYVFADDFVIFDEAHMLEAVAAQGLGAALSRYRVLAAIHKVYNPRTKKGLLAAQRPSLRRLSSEAERATTLFFDSLLYHVTPHPPARSERHGLTQTPREFRLRSPSPVPNILDVPLSRLEGEVLRRSQNAENEQQRQELSAAHHALADIRSLIRELLDQSREGFAYWIEAAGTTGENITLHSAPVEVAQVLGPAMFRDGTSVIMTSATLAVNGGLGYIQQRLGAEDVRGIILDSPFDHMRQMKVRIAADIPEPDTEEFAEALPSWIMKSIEDTSGRALVLFTSTVLMRTVASALADELVAKGFPLLVQGEQKSRFELLSEFRRDVRAVLFGLDSFWMGIDVPGESLEHVIITRLPFAVPTHPLTEARIELIASRGGNAFAEYTLPEAIIKFRQGVGRLIRTSTDRGLVTVLDSRLITRRYGRIFFASLPRCQVEILRASGEVESIPLDGWE